MKSVKFDFSGYKGSAISIGKTVKNLVWIFTEFSWNERLLHTLHTAYRKLDNIKKTRDLKKNSKTTWNLGYE